MNIATLDAVIIIVYLLGIMAIGIWVGFRRDTTSDQFFLAGKSLRWPIIGLALFTSNISTIHLVGLAADGYRIGLVAWPAVFLIIGITGFNIYHSWYQALLAFFLVLIGSVQKKKHHGCNRKRMFLQNHQKDSAACFNDSAETDGPSCLSCGLDLVCAGSIPQRDRL